MRAGQRPVVVLDDREDNVGALREPALSFVEHGDGLASSRSCAKVDAQVAASPDAGVNDRGLNPSDPRRFGRLHLVARVPDGKTTAARRDGALDPGGTG